MSRTSRRSDAGVKPTFRIVSKSMSAEVLHRTLRREPHRARAHHHHRLRDLRLGLSSFKEEEAQKNAAMIHASDRVVVLADSSKFGTPSLHRICDIRDVHMIVTDTDVDPALVEKLEDRGVAVYCLDVRTAQSAVDRRRGQQ